MLTIQSEQQAVVFTAAAAKKELVAKLSHDIRTPVAGIKAASEVGAALTADDKNRGELPADHPEGGPDQHAGD